MTDYQHDIEKYLKGELTPAERHALEKKALSDPLLADALEGAEKIGSHAFASDVAELNKKIAGRKEHSMWIWPMRVAAGVVILIASTYIVWQAFETQPETKQLAFEQKNEPDTTSQPSVEDSDLKEEEVLSQLSEKTTAGPSVTEKDKTQSTYQFKAEAKPSEPLIAESQPKPVVSTGGAGEITPSESKADEDVSLAKSADREDVAENEAALKNKSEEVQRAKKITIASDDQKKEMAAPLSRADRSSGVTYADKKIIRGRVTSTEDGSSLPGVNVVIKGTTTGTITDQTGNYQIEIENSNPVLVYSFIGLESREVSAGDQTAVDVSLSLDVTQLSEVVVTGYGFASGSAAASTVDLAHPANGYRTFKQYLLQSLRYPSQALQNKVEGKVTVEFNVETNGSLTNFRIIRGIGSGCDEELIRLIQDGPRWEPTKNDGVSIQDKARVRLKFELPK